MNPQECVWEIRYCIITKTIVQEKVKIHYSTTTWFTNLFLCLEAMIIPAPKAAVDKELEKLEKTSAWNLTKVRSKSEVIDEARWPGGWGPQGRPNRRRRTREGPEPACVQTPLCFEMAHAGEEG